MMEYKCTENYFKEEMRKTIFVERGSSNKVKAR